MHGGVAGATIVSKSIALGNPPQNCFRPKSLTRCVSASGDALWTVATNSRFATPARALTVCS
jgi:hypothetical protein